MLQSCQVCGGGLCVVRSAVGFADGVEHELSGCQLFFTESAAGCSIVRGEEVLDSWGGGVCRLGPAAVRSVRRGTILCRGVYTYQ